MDDRAHPDEGWWVGYGDLVRDMLWDDLDMGRLSRALVRTSAACGWIVLAVASGAVGWYWGLPMLVVCLLTILHARRVPFLALSGWPARIQAMFLPQPDRPTIHALGIADGVGCLVTAASTTYVFNQDDVTRQGTIAAVLLVGVVLAAGAVNVSAHVGWELGHAPVSWRRWRPYGGPIMGLASGLVLWPRMESPQATVLTYMALFVIPIAVIATYFYGWWRLDKSSTLRRHKAAAIRKAARLVDSRHLHVIKNLLSPLTDTVSAHHETLQAGQPLTADALLRARQALQAVTALTTTTEIICREDQLVGEYFGVREAVSYMQSVVNQSDRGLELTVTEDLDPESLLPADRELIWTVASDFTSNAYKARATRFSIGVTSESADSDDTCQVILRASCDCDASNPVDIRPGTSLALLARFARRLGGRLDASQVDELHHYQVSWPTFATPRPRQARQEKL